MANFINRKQKYVFGNWKMNKTLKDAIKYVDIFNDLLGGELTKVRVVLFVPFPFLEPLARHNKKSLFAIGAQCVSSHEDGAFTGEVSASIIASVNVKYCLVGHSEQRLLFASQKLNLSGKITRLLQNSITPILCVGENQQQHLAKQTTTILAKQVNSVLEKISTREVQKIIIAYEPIWAIGTGLVASEAQIIEACGIVRVLLAKKYTRAVANEIVILYGGSVSRKNIAQICKISLIDGVLIGGSSLLASEMVAICRAYE